VRGIYIYLLVSFIVYSSICVSTSIARADDGVGPEIINIELDKKRITSGQQANLYLTVEDKDDLVLFGELTILTPNGQRENVPISLYNDAYLYTFDFLNNFQEDEYGFYKIIEVKLSDRYGNYSYTDLEKYNLNIEVYMDNSPPTIDQVDISRAIVYSIGYEDVHFTVKVQEENNLSEYGFMYLKHQKSGEEIKMLLSCNDVTNECTRQVLDFYDYLFGEWIISKIEVEDLAGNSAVYQGPFTGNSSMKILNIKDDSEKPRYISSAFEEKTEKYIVKAIDNSFLAEIRVNLRHQLTGKEIELVSDPELFNQNHSSGIELDIPLVFKNRKEFSGVSGKWDVINIEIQDKNQNVSIISNVNDSLSFDLSGPIVNGIKERTYGYSVSPTFDEGTAKLNDKPFISGTRIWSSGDYVLKVEDEFGNETVVRFKIDTQPVVINGVKNGATYQQGTAFFNEGNGLLNGVPYVSGTTITESGEYNLAVTDEAGNVTRVWFFIDNLAPNVSGFLDGIINYQEVSPTFIEGTATLNGIPYVSGTKVIQEGKYILSVTDRAGNETVIHFSIDRTAPVISGVTSKQLTNKSVTVAFNEGSATLNGKNIASGQTIVASGSYTLKVTDEAENSMVSITYNGRTYTTKASTAGTYSYSLKTTKAGATLTVRAKDAAGNLSTTASSKVLNTFATFTVNTVKSSATSVTGKGNKAATVQAFVGTKAISKTAKVDSKGNYKLTIPRQKAGATVTVKMTQTGYQELKKMTKVIK